MNFVQYLMKAPVLHITEPVKPAGVRTDKSATIAGRCRLHLEGQRRTICELMELTGFSHNSIASTIKRLKASGKVVVVGKTTQAGSRGKWRSIYTWVHEVGGN